MEDISEGSGENTHADDNGGDRRDGYKEQDETGGLLSFPAWWKESGSTRVTRRPET